MNSFERLLNLKGKVAVIAGGLGQVGFATAKRLASQEARIVCLMRRNLEQAKAKMKELPHFEKLQHMAIEADITKSETLFQAAEVTMRETGACHILVNAAGVTRSIPPKNLNELTDEIFDEIMITNLRGVFSTIRAFAPLLKKSGDGLIVNISSTASLRASDSNVAYASAKAGLNLMSRSLAKALAPEVRVLSIVPGYLEQATSGATKTEAFNDWAAQTSPLKRIGSADDIANAIEAYATTIRFATGDTVIVDGGRTL